MMMRLVDLGLGGDGLSVHLYHVLRNRFIKIIVPENKLGVCDFGLDKASCRGWVVFQSFFH